MAVSKSPRKRAVPAKTQNRLLRAEMRRQKAAERSRARRAIGVAMLVVGAGLLLDSIAARIGGAHLLAFDTHHMIGQLGGIALLMLGTIRVGGG